MFLRWDYVCVDLLTFVSSSRFYKKIAFVPLSLYQNCQVSKKIEYSQSEEHIDGSTEGLQSEEHIYVSLEEWSACGP